MQRWQPIVVRKGSDSRAHSMLHVPQTMTMQERQFGEEIRAKIPVVWSKKFAGGSRQDFRHNLCLLFNSCYRRRNWKHLAGKLRSWKSDASQTKYTGRVQPILHVEKLQVEVFRNVLPSAIHTCDAQLLHQLFK